MDAIKAGAGADDVRAWRKAAGVTQREAAHAVGLSRWQTWCEWEAGRVPADPVRLALFRHLAGLDRLPFGQIGVANPNYRPVSRGRRPKIPG